MARAPHHNLRKRRAKGAVPSGEQDSPDELSEDQIPGAKTHEKDYEIPRGSRHRQSDDGDGFAREHPMGWGARTTPKRPTARDESEREAVEKEREVKASNAFAQYLAAAALIPGTTVQPVPLECGLRVVLHASTAPPGSVEVCSRLEVSTNMTSDAALPDVQDFDGAPGVIDSTAPDDEGRWFLDVTKRGEVFRLAAPAWCLLWKGAPVLVRSSQTAAFDGQGLLAAERVERDTGCWRVCIRKVLALSPVNLHLPSCLITSESRALHRGAAVEVQGLQKGKEYNGACGTVLSSSPNPQGRWEVEVAYTLYLPPWQLTGVKPQQHGATPLQSQSPDKKGGGGGGDGSEIVGKLVEVHGLKSAPQHNSKRGVVLGRASGSSERWRVSCKSADGAEVLLDLRLGNIRVLASADSKEESNVEAQLGNGTPSPPEVTAASTETTGSHSACNLQLGVVVQIQGLKSSPQYNGQRGVVLGKSLQNSERWRVQLDIGQGGQLMLDLRPANLVCLPGKPSSAAPTSVPGELDVGTDVKHPTNDSDSERILQHDHLEESRDGVPTSDTRPPEFRPAWKRQKVGAGVTRSQRSQRISCIRRADKVVMDDSLDEDPLPSNAPLLQRAPPPAPPMPRVELETSKGLLSGTGLMPPPAPQMPEVSEEFTTDSDSEVVVASESRTEMSPEPVLDPMEELERQSLEKT